MSAYAGERQPPRRFAGGGPPEPREWWYATAVISGPVQSRDQHATGAADAPASAAAGTTGRAADVALAINPAAGGGRGAAVGARAAASLRAAGLTVAEVIGATRLDAGRRMRSAVDAGCGALIACGGDGMVNLALQVVAGTDVPLGIVPAGSGNDFARTLDQPLTESGWLAAAVAAGRTRSIDLGRAGRPVVRHGARRRVRLAGERPDEPDALPAGPAALPHGHRARTGHVPRTAVRC